MKNKYNKTGLIETIEIISDVRAMKEIEEAIKAYNSGKGKTLEQLRRELGL